MLVGHLAVAVLVFVERPVQHDRTNRAVYGQYVAVLVFVERPVQPAREVVERGFMSEVAVLVFVERPVQL